MANQLRPVTDEEPKTLGTPEGDNEFGPDEPLRPVDGLQVPRGAETGGTASADYKKDES